MTRRYLVSRWHIGSCCTVLDRQVDALDIARSDSHMPCVTTSGQLRLLVYADWYLKPKRVVLTPWSHHRLFWRSGRYRVYLTPQSRHMSSRHPGTASCRAGALERPRVAYILSGDGSPRSTCECSRMTYWLAALEAPSLSRAEKIFHSSGGVPESSDSKTLRHERL